MYGRRLVLALLGSIVLAPSVACKKDPSSSSSGGGFVTLGPSTSAVRDAFDRDVGSVRVLMLVSPT